MKCIHSNCSRKADYMMLGNRDGEWCKECMQYQLGFTKEKVCTRCKKDAFPDRYSEQSKGEKDG